MKSVFHEFFLDNEYILNLNFFDILVAIKEEQTLQEFNNGLTLHKKKGRSRYQRCSVKTCALKNLANFTGKHYACNFIKKRLQHRCFPVKFVKFIRTPILKNIYERNASEKIKFLFKISLLNVSKSSAGLLTFTEKIPKRKLNFYAA